MFCAQKPRTCQKYPKCIQKTCKCIFLRFATLCSAHRSPELVKSIPNANKTYASPFVEICDVMSCAPKPRTCQQYPKCIHQKILTKSSLSRRELPPATFALLEGGTLPKCTENKLSFKRNSATFRLSIDLRRYVLRTEARNLSKVSQMHPENMQEHFLRFATLCSAHRGPELVKSIPNASRTKCKCICLDLRRYVLRTETQNCSTVSQMHAEKLQVHF